MELFPKPDEVIELHRFFIISCLIIFYSALALWPLGWIFRRPGLVKDDSKPLKYRPIFSIGRYFSIFLTLLSVVVYYFLRKHMELIDASNFPGIDNTADSIFNILIALPSLLVILFPVQLILLILILIGKHGTKVFRIHISLVTIALLIFLIFLFIWNLVFPGYYFTELF